MSQLPLQAPSASAFGAGYLRYAVGLLFAVNLLNVIDRMIMGVLVDPIKRDLLLSDTQMSLVSGFSFVLFYLIVGIAISRWIDRGSRRVILACGLGVWSLATAFTGMASDFLSLIVARVLVGAGEATAFPVAMSLIGDYFSKERRPRIIALFQTSNAIGIITGSILAGVLGLKYGWRWVFMLFGAIGVVVALIYYFSLREPVRAQTAPEDVAPIGKDGLLDAIRRVLRLPGFVSLSVGYGMAYGSLGIMASWAPAFLQRSHGLNIAETGKVIGPAVGLGSVTGALIAGVLASRLVARTGQQRDGLRVTLFILPFAIPCLAAFLYAPALPMALVALGIANFCTASVMGPPVALLIGLAPPNARALSSTLMLTMQALIAGGGAPLLVGVLSDALAPSFGQESLRYAMTAAVAAPLLGSLFFLHAFMVIGRHLSSAPAAKPATMADAALAPEAN